jgi:hypothetical protein
MARVCGTATKAHLVLFEFMSLIYQIRNNDNDNHKSSLSFKPFSSPKPNICSDHSDHGLCRHSTAAATTTQKVQALIMCTGYSSGGKSTTGAFKRAKAVLKFPDAHSFTMNHNII